MDEREESDVPRTFTSEYYDEKYFAGEKTYRKADGTLGKWGYNNLEGEWTGAADVAYAWQVMFNPKKMLDIGCVLPECEILTMNGCKTTQEITIGEKLPNSQVLKTFSRDYEGDLIHIKPEFLEEILFTTEHPILIARKKQTGYWRTGKWSFIWHIIGFKRADEVKFSKKYYECDYVVIPKIKEEREDYLHFPMPDPTRGGGNGKILGSQIVDETWARIIGWYLSEGYVDNTTVCFALGYEPNYAEEILALCRSKGLNGEWKYRKQRAGILVRVCSVSLAKLLKNICGRGAKNKHLPLGFLLWKKNILSAMLDTYVKGDGNLIKRKEYEGFKVTSASKRLIKEVQVALLKIGFPSSFYIDKHAKSEIEGRPIPERIAYALIWTKTPYFKYDDENNYYFKIKRLKHSHYSGKVCNLKTTSETYQVPFVVHNCGRGTFIAYARDIGIEAVGFDFSRYAINNPYTKCKPEWLSLHDARNKWNYPDHCFDLVVALDFFEHLYEEDLACVEKEMFRVAKKWVFILIATTRGGNNGQTEKYIKANPMRILSLEKQLLDQGMRFRPGIRGTDYTLKKDVPHYEGRNEPAEGHVTFQPEEYWLNRFAKYGTYRPDLVDYFCTLADNRVIENWILNSILVMEVGKQ